MTISSHDPQGLLTRLGMAADTASPLVAAHSGPTRELVGQALTDGTFRSLGVAVAEARARLAAGRPGVADTLGSSDMSCAATTPAPTWLYEFAWRSEAAGNNGLAFPCLDLPFWWDCLGAEQVEAATGPRPPQHLAGAMHTAWVRFVSGADPGWPAYDLGTRTARVWDEAPSLAHDHLRSVRELWRV